MDTLFRFELDETYFINSFCVRADSFTDAISQITLVLGDSIMSKVVFIHKIN